MLSKRSEKGLILLAVVVATALFVYWLLYNPVKDIHASIPGMDNRPKESESSGGKVKIGEGFDFFKELSTDLKGKWVQFRGANSDNISADQTKLINSWGNGPKIDWQVELGEGHAAPVVYNGKVYVLDYDEVKKADALRCFSLETGEELWRRWYRVRIKRNHGISRTVPAINDKYLITIGPRCHVMCTDPNTGDFLWGIDLVKDYMSEIPFWYTGQCPIIVDNIAIIAPGGSSLLMGVDCATGKVVWETPNPDGWKMSHSSVMPMNLNGKKMWVYAAVGGIVGVSAEGDDLGEILWKTKDFAPSVVAPSPIVFGNGKVYMTAGYGAGGILLQVKKSGNKYSVETLQKFKPKDGIASEQQTPILYDGHMFSILPKDAGGLRNRFVCVDPNDSQKILWDSGSAHRFGLGPYVVADGKFFILKDDGTISIAKATSKSFQFLDKAKIMDGHDAWGPLVVVDGRLLMRDDKHMVCIDVRRN
ncbi:PQQ-binding-like beta-propeller repeat protein [Marinifilum sp. D714]|uniref:outer membrane protein assembly factor BamB family protein n=1 Tax=Marinifilum sp. D714 TaxID=2937523 RepID=UPI0027CEA694|nr:PQQ-binding-like beta-propeller repeat protein [Marinifilum sp. D714]MDQ2178034.1 PQQ-like beta-propeller repeat protein [Marinifilum sp. D714]